MSCQGPFNLRGTALELYEGTARSAPIYDYHCHLSPREICEDAVLANVGQAMLGGDHYKWRAMRYCGLPENLVTGDGGWFDKFAAWMGVCERLAGSPLQVWTRMELRAFFGIGEEICADNARSIYDQCNSVIRERGLSPRKIMAAMNVRAVCTTDDPLDDLRWHEQLAEDASMTCKVLPTFRPDAVFKIQDAGYARYILRLAETAGSAINGFEQLLDALSKRLAYFHARGCLFSDHSLECLEFAEAETGEIETIFAAALRGQPVSRTDCARYRFRLLRELGAMYAQQGIVMQVHMGAMRNVNARAFSALGVDAGYDVPNDFRAAEPMAALMNAMDSRNALPRMILYTLNPKDYQALAALCPAFTQPGVPGKVQLGPAWWHCDTENGMAEQIAYAGSFGLLPPFWGMLTDSRSFLSYPRHDYFRRILCRYFGGLKDSNTYQGKTATLAAMVEDISYGNVARFIDQG